MIDESDWPRLARYFAGEGSHEERRETERWIADVPARAEFVARLRAGWERAGEPVGPFDVDRAWDEVARRKTVRSAPGITPAPAVPHIRRPLLLHTTHVRARRQPWVTAVAAAVVLALGTGVVWKAGFWTTRPSAGTAVEPMRVVTTGHGETAEVNLSDGTRVRLGPASTLRFARTFGDTRSVYLDAGEGYFDVEHDPAREFAVHTPQAVVRDIGTQFDVRAYPGESGTQVVVAEGAVALKAADARTGADSAVLTRADLAHVDAAGMLRVTRRVDVDAYVAWTQKRLVFDQTPLRDVLPQLSRWYDVDMAAGDSTLAGVRLTATLELESFPDALRRLSALLDARTERRGRAILLYSKHRTR